MADIGENPREYEFEPLPETTEAPIETSPAVPETTPAPAEPVPA